MSELIRSYSANWWFKFFISVLHKTVVLKKDLNRDWGDGPAESDAYCVCASGKWFPAFWISGLVIWKISEENETDMWLSALYVISKGFLSSFLPSPPFPALSCRCLILPCSLGWLPDRHPPALAPECWGFRHFPLTTSGSGQDITVWDLTVVHSGTYCGYSVWKYECFSLVLSFVCCKGCEVCSPHSRNFS